MGSPVLSEAIPLVERGLGQLRGEARLEADHEPHRDHEAQRAEEAGDDPRDEQVADGLLRQHAVNDEGGARRDEAADGPRTGQRAHGELVVVAVLAHLREGDGGHGDAARQHVPDDGPEQRAGGHAADGEPAAQVSEPLARAAVDVLAESGVEAQVAHEHEEHEGRPCIAAGRRVHGFAEGREARRNAAQVGDEDKAGGHECEGDGHAEEEEGEQEDEPGDAHDDAAHAGQPVRRDPPRADHGQACEAEGDGGPPVPGAAAGFREIFQEIVQQGEGEQGEAERREPDEGRKRNPQHQRDRRGRSRIPGGRVGAEDDGHERPQRRGDGEQGPVGLGQLGGQDVHGDVAFLPLRVGDGGKDHDDHHELRDLHGAVDRLAEPVPQEHVDERQEHHEHEDAHARRAQPFGEAFRRKQRGRRPVQKTCSVGMRAFHTSFPFLRGRV